MELTAPDRSRVLKGIGARVGRFAQGYIVQTKGRWAGGALNLEPWQQEFLDELFLVYPDGERVYREALLGIARKNGKSTISAAIALYMLMASGEHGPEVYVAAGSKDQARIVFNQAREFVEASPRLRDWLSVQKDVITCKSNNGVFRVLAADAGTNYGLNPSAVVIDELHVHQDPELYYSLTTGQLAREAPLVVSITTAGFDRSSICYSLYQRGKELERRGGIKAMRAEAFLFKWYEADSTATVQDPEGWQAANPSSWIKAEDLARESRRLPESVFRRLHLNQWTESEDAWIKPHHFDACRGVPVFDASLPSVRTVDVGFKRDSAALLTGQWHGEELHVHHDILLPEEMGPRFGVSDIRGILIADAQHDQALQEIAYDPWQFRESAEIMAEGGFPMVEFPQSSRMEQASTELYELILAGRIVHDGNEQFRRQVLAAVSAPTDRGGWKISKRKSLERIDACVALAMLAERAVTLKTARRPPSGAAFL
jgi:phage terminase large subunit-like protein